MIIRVFRWIGGQWDGSVPFSEAITSAKFRDSLPSKSRRRLYVTKHMRLVHIRFPWDTAVPAGGMAEVTLTEAEIFRLASFARRGRSDEELLKSIRSASD